MAKSSKNTSQKSPSSKKNVNSTKEKKSSTKKSNTSTKTKKTSSKTSTKKKSLVSAQPIKEPNITSIITNDSSSSNTYTQQELLNKIVNASTEEEKKNSPSANETATSEEPKKRRKRGRKIKTWEEKAKKLPTFQVSDFPKFPVKSILITQAKPADLQNPYQLLTDKYKVIVNFRPFIKVEGLTAQEFRNQRVDVLEYKGIIFTSRLAVDNFFRIMNEMRVTLPETTKFFCLNEQIAYYLQKYMEFRKRRIFWGQGTIDDLKNVLKKNIDGKFLLPASDTIREKVMGILDHLNAKYSAVDVYKTVPENISDLKPEQYDMIVFFTPIAVEALHKYFPKYKQNKTRFAAYSILTANKLQELGYRVDIYAPTLEFPSMVNAISHYLSNVKSK